MSGGSIRRSHWEEKHVIWKQVTFVVLLLATAAVCVFVVDYDTLGYIDVYASETETQSGAKSYTLTRYERFSFLPGTNTITNPISAAQFDALRPRSLCETIACGPTHSTYTLNFIRDGW